MRRRGSAPTGPLAWLSWSKPRMPWDGTELWLADISPRSQPRRARRIAGGDRVGAARRSGPRTVSCTGSRTRPAGGTCTRCATVSARAVCPDRAEYAAPPWQHGRRRYGFLGDGSIVAVRIRDAVHELVRIYRGGRRRRELLTAELTWVADGHLSCHGTTVAFAGATPIAEPAVLALDTRSERITMLDRRRAAVGTDVVSPPARRSGSPARTARELHGVLVRAGARRHSPRRAGRPPLLLHLHGGPTDGARLALDPELQLWTSRGFALLDLNYSGSTGFGSAYRHRLDGEWGERDFGDCVAAVGQLTGEGLVDPERVFVRGASAGGYLTLRCVTGSTAFFRGHGPMRDLRPRPVA